MSVINACEMYKTIILYVVIFVRVLEIKSVYDMMMRIDNFTCEGKVKNIIA